MKVYNIEQGSMEWLLWRRGGVTATDAAAINGTSKWNTRLDVWKDKTDTNPPEQKTSSAMEWGHRIEPVLRDKFAEVFETKVKPSELFQNDAHPWMLASLDGRAVVDGNYVIVECKTTHAREDWFDEDDNEIIPAGYQTQALWQMMVTGIKTVYFSVLVNGSEWFYRVFHYDEDRAKKLLEQCLELWGHVLNKTTPEPQNGPLSENDAKTYAAIAADSEQTEVADADVTLVAEYKKWKEALDTATEKLNDVKARIAHELEGKVCLMHEGRKFASIITRKGAESIDKEKFKKLDPSLYRSCVKIGKPSSYVKIN